MMMSYSLGEAVLTSIPGSLMGGIHPMTLFGFLFEIAMVMAISFHHLLKPLQRDSRERRMKGVKLSYEERE